MSSIRSDPSSAPPSYQSHGSRAGTPSPSPPESRTSTDSEVLPSYIPDTILPYTPQAAAQPNPPSQQPPSVSPLVAATATVPSETTNALPPRTYRSLLPPLDPVPPSLQPAKFETGRFNTSQTYKTPKGSNRCCNISLSVIGIGGIIGVIILMCWMFSPVNPSSLKTMRGNINILSTPNSWDFLAPLTEQDEQSAKDIAMAWARVQIYRIPSAILEDRVTKEKLPEGVEYMRCDGNPGKQKHKIGFRKRSLDEPEPDRSYPQPVTRMGRLFRRGGVRWEPGQYAGFKNDWEWERGWGVVWSKEKRLCMPHSDEMLEFQRKWAGEKLEWWRRERDRKEKKASEGKKSEKERSY